MKTIVTTLIFFSLLSATQVVQAQDQAPIEQLSWLIGTWQFDDRAMPAAGYDYQETGTRTCIYVFDRRYIQCTSVGHSGTHTRTYAHFWTWNEQSERIEMLSMFGNLPIRPVATGYLEDEGHTVILESDQYEDEGHIYTSLYEIRYDGEGGMIWQSRRKSVDAEPETAVRFHEAAMKIAD